MATPPTLAAGFSSSSSSSESLRPAKPDLRRSSLLSNLQQTHQDYKLNKKSTYY